jgi:hypothetical protein
MKRSVLSLVDKFYIQEQKYIFLNKQKQNEPNYIKTELDALHKNKKKKKKHSIKKQKQKNNGYTGSRDISYSDFLKTGYWLYVKILVQKRDGRKCVECGSKNKLHIHHLTYKNHFEEHKHLSDMITLCEACHNKKHINKTFF